MGISFHGFNKEDIFIGELQNIYTWPYRVKIATFVDIKAHHS